MTMISLRPLQKPTRVEASGSLPRRHSGPTSGHPGSGQATPTGRCPHSCTEVEWMLWWERQTRWFMPQMDGCPAFLQGSTCNSLASACHAASLAQQRRGPIVGPRLAPPSSVAASPGKEWTTGVPAGQGAQPREWPPPPGRFCLRGAARPTSQGLRLGPSDVPDGRGWRRCLLGYLPRRSSGRNGPGREKASMQLNL